MLVDQHEMMKMWEEYMVKLFDDNTGLQPVLQNEEGKWGSVKSNQRTEKRKGSRQWRHNHWNVKNCRWEWCNFHMWAVHLHEWKDTQIQYVNELVFIPLLKNEGYKMYRLLSLLDLALRILRPRTMWMRNITVVRTRLCGGNKEDTGQELLAANHQWMEPYDDEGISIIKNHS